MRCGVWDTSYTLRRPGENWGPVPAQTAGATPSQVCSSRPGGCSPLTLHRNFLCSGIAASARLVFILLPAPLGGTDWLSFSWAPAPGALEGCGVQPVCLGRAPLTGGTASKGARQGPGAHAFKAMSAAYGLLSLSWSLKAQKASCFHLCKSCPLP